MAMLRKMREHVEKNFENVGERFPEEARRIHYGEAEEREIYGQATPEEAKELDRRRRRRCARCRTCPSSTADQRAAGRQQVVDARVPGQPELSRAPS